MFSDDIRTTLNKNGIGTSFTHSNKTSYFVSTVENPPDSNQYESLIKVSHKRVIPIFLITSNNIKDAVINHIATSRMAISNDVKNWNEETAIDFVPLKLVELFKSIEIEEKNRGFDTEYCKSMLMSSGLNYDLDSGKNIDNNGLYNKAYLTLLLTIVSSFVLFVAFSKSILDGIFAFTLFLVFMMIVVRFIFGYKYALPPPIKVRKGEERLWKVFWLYNVTVVLLFSLIINFIRKIGLSLENHHDPTRLIMGIELVLGILYIAYLIRALISLWKCAFNVDTKVWGYLARLYVLMYVFGTLGITILIMHQK